MAESKLMLPRLGESFTTTVGTKSVTVNASSNTATTIDFSKAGWQPLGVMECYTSNPNVIIYGCYMSAYSDGSATVRVSLRNWSTSNATVTITTGVFWTLLGG